MHAASGALFKLAGTVEDAQRTVLDAARTLKAARDAAHRAQVQAQQARAEADTDFAKLLVGPLSTPGHPVSTPAELAAQRAENSAATAQSHALDVERWAQGQAKRANDDVTSGDRACAGVLEHAGLVPAQDLPTLIGAAPAPTTPLIALGTLLLGAGGGGSRAGLAALLSSPPPPPPPPPPKPAQKHHSFWKSLAAGGMVVVTGGLIVVDALQLGLDPVTDGATVAAGGETVALTTEAVVGETVAGETVVAGTATATEGLVAETEAGVLAAEGAPAEGLAVQEGTTDALVEDGSAGGRPPWQTSEKDVEQKYLDEGYRKQVSFKDGEEVPYGTKGSTRPDVYKPGDSVEVKNYDVATPKGRSSLLRNVVNQVRTRTPNLPDGTTQSIAIDVRGQNVTLDELNQLASRIAARTGGRIDMSHISFLR